MSLIKWADDKTKKLGIWDTKLVALAGICIGLILAILIPAIVNVSIWWYIIIGILCLIRVYYVILFEKKKEVEEEIDEEVDEEFEKK